MKTKAETDAEILNSATQADNDISTINIRNTDSVHPIQCSCTLCKNTQHKEGLVIPEREEKRKLDWYGEDTA